MTDTPDKPKDTGVATRLLAFDVLEAVLQDGATIDDAFDRARRKTRGKWEARDVAHAKLIILTTLRGLGQIDALINRYLTRKPSGKGRASLTLLRLGAAQMMFLETPPHAAVSTVLSVADKRRLQGFKGLLNAVLRKLAGSLPNALRTQDAARLNTPDWLWDRCETAFGPSETRRIMESHGAEAPLDITLKDPGETTWVDRLKGDRLPTGSLRLWNAGDVPQLPGFKSGDWWVQDAAAALPGRVLMAGMEGTEAGKKVADLCAAPGGKTAQLAAAGMSVTAVEISGNRMKRLKENLSRLNLNADMVEADVLNWAPDDPFDAVLLDAPCSATGTIRRHPDLPWRKEGWDLGALTVLQTNLLVRAMDFVKPNGIVVYATCSLLPDEGEKIVSGAQAKGAPFDIDPIDTEEVPGLAESITAEGFVRTFPYQWRGRNGPRRGGLDGFFIARLRRH